MLLNTRIPASYLFRKVRLDLVYLSVISLVVYSISNFYHNEIPIMPLAIPTFIGTAISILLSFKISQSYDRWWEARKVWGSIVNDSRSLVIQALSLVDDNSHPLVKRVAYRQIAWCYSLGQALRGRDSMAGLDEFLPAEELKALEQHRNRPLAMLHQHAQDLSALRRNNLLDAYSHVQMDNTLVRLCDAQGKAERIKSTVFPTTYRLFLRFIIYLFVVTLSIALNEVPWYFEIPLLILISTSFFLLERSATHMQDPFEDRPTDTAVTAIARTIEINIRQLLKEDQVPAPYAPQSFYLT